MNLRSSTDFAPTLVRRHNGGSTKDRRRNNLVLEGNKEKVVEPSETNFREIIWMIENLFVILQHILQNTVFL